MKNFLLDFTKQLAEALAIGNEIKLQPLKSEIQNILVSGLGGSGIGGNLVSEIVSQRLSLTFNVNKDYTLPSYVNDNTLVIISSYSGNTEETISALNYAVKKNAHIVCVSSGGKIIKIAQEQNISHIVIPEGMPPRACLGYSFIQQLYILYFYKCIDEIVIKELWSAIDLLNVQEISIQKDAYKIAEQLLGKTPVIYISAYMESVALRFRQQLNENAKMLAWHHVFPELNHNELVGWNNINHNLAIVIFRNINDFERNRHRIEISKNIFIKYTPNIIEIYSKGKSFIENALYLIHLGDWISYYLAEKQNIDAVEVKVIDYLKSELSKNQ